MFTSTLIGKVVEAVWVIDGETANSSLNSVAGYVQWQHLDRTVVLNPSEGGFSHHKLWIVWQKNMCLEERIGLCKSWISNWSWCSPTEHGVHTLMGTHARTHTHTPWQFLACCVHATRLQLNETYLWQEHAAHVVPHAGVSWILTVDLHTHIHTITHRHTVTPEEERLMERWGQNGKILSPLLPCYHTGPYLTLLRLLALCPMLWPCFPYSSSFYPAANTSLFLALSLFVSPVGDFALSLSLLFLLKSLFPKSLESSFSKYTLFHLPVLLPHTPSTEMFEPLWPYFKQLFLGTAKRTLWAWLGFYQCGFYQCRHLTTLELHSGVKAQRLAHPDVSRESSS